MTAKTAKKASTEIAKKEIKASKKLVKKIVKETKATAAKQVEELAEDNGVTTPFIFLPQQEEKKLPAKTQEQVEALFKKAKKTRLRYPRRNLGCIC